MKLNDSQVKRIEELTGMKHVDIENSKLQSPYLGEIFVDEDGKRLDIMYADGKYSIGTQELVINIKILEAIIPVLEQTYHRLFDEAVEKGIYDADQYSLFYAYEIEGVEETWD